MPKLIGGPDEYNGMPVADDYKGRSIRCPIKRTAKFRIEPVELTTPQPEEFHLYRRRDPTGDFEYIGIGR